MWWILRVSSNGSVVTFLSNVFNSMMKQQNYLSKYYPNRYLRTHSHLGIVAILWFMAISNNSILLQGLGGSFGFFLAWLYFQKISPCKSPLVFLGDCQLFICTNQPNRYKKHLWNDTVCGNTPYTIGKTSIIEFRGKISYTTGYFPVLIFTSIK